MIMRKQIVVGNWKMNGSRVTNEILVSHVINDVNENVDVECVICVPFPFLGQVQTLVKNSELSLGAQNVSDQVKGAFTGEVSASMLTEFGCKFVILGHSERRMYNLENDVLIGQKARSAIANGLTPIICLGESLEEREAGDTKAIIKRQLHGALGEVGHESLERCIFAYEPIWAIGTGKTAKPEAAQEVHRFIREEITHIDNYAGQQVRIIYGGSVKSDNAFELFSNDDIDGGLVGGASLSGEDFKKIYLAAKQKNK